MNTWTKPYYGVQHLGEMSDLRRASVNDYGTFAEALLFTRGIGCIEQTYSTAAEARAAGEAWVTECAPKSSNSSNG